MVGHEEGEREKKIAGNEANKLTEIMVTKYVRFFKHSGKMLVLAICTHMLSW